MNLQQITAYFDTFISYEISLPQNVTASFKLDRIRALLDLVGNPHKQLKFVHVAGSKGKGSTCSFIASMLKEAGYCVGLYTSPHIHHYRERIRILNNPLYSNLEAESDPPLFEDCIPVDQLGEVIDEIKPAIEKIRKDKSLGRLSLYEAFTVIALCAFLKSKADIVVLETGLGGRLDATNVVSSLIAVITPISYEHTQILGDTLTAISTEKSAIIKEDTKGVVFSPQEDEVREVILNRCRQFHIDPIDVSLDFECQVDACDLHAQTMRIKTKQNKYDALKTPLLGRHQMLNAAVALGVIEQLNKMSFDVPTESIYKGMENVRWPTRFEVMGSEPLLILDSAHTPDSAKALVNTMERVLPGKKVTLVFGLSNDKNKKLISQELNEIVTNVILTKAQHPRSEDLIEEEMGRLFSGKEICKAASVEEALDVALKESKKEDIILITGSLFVTSEARKYLSNLGSCHVST